MTEECPDFSAPPIKRRRRNFFDVLSTRQPNVVEEDEVSKYLSDPVGKTCILKYPILSQLYFRHNAALPSFASVERLFSTGGIIFKPTRTLLSDEMFESLIFLKCNSNM